MRSSSTMREHRTSEQASEAGPRWQNRGIGGGSERTAARAAFVRTLVDESHPVPSSLTLSFDEGAAAAVLASALPACRHEVGSLRGITRRRDKDDRGVCHSTVHAVDNAAAREHRPERYSALLNRDEIVRGRPEARWASSNAHRPGADPLCRCATRPQGRGASGMCGSAPAVRQRGSPKKRRVTARGVGRWRRKPHARELNASRVHGSCVGCRSRDEASCRGKSASVLLGSHGLKRQRHGTDDERGAAAAS